MRRSLIILLTLMLALTACLPAKNTGDSQSQIATSVALTVNAQNQMATNVALTLTAQSPNFTETPTFIPGGSTPFDIPTITPIPPIFIPTATPFSVNPTAGSGGYTKPQYACDAIRRPFDNTKMLPLQVFDVKWTIINVGTKAWAKGKDLKFYGGTDMNPTTRRFELPYMAPGDKFHVEFEATAPKKTGFYVMTWAIDGPVCFPYVAIIVK